MSIFGSGFSGVISLAREKLSKSFLLLSLIIIAILAILLFQKRFHLYFEKVPYNLKLVRVIISGSGTTAFKGPADIFFDGNRSLYIVDSGNSRILKYNVNGGYVSQWGLEGKATGEFMVPLYGTISESLRKVYIVDSGNSRIQTFNPDGTFEYQFGNSSDSAKQLVEPTYLGLFGNSIYVANSGSDNIIVFNKNGGFYRSINFSGSGSSGKITGSSGHPAGNINIRIDIKKPVSMAFSGKYIYISDYDTSKIFVFNRQFDFVGTIGNAGEKGFGLYHPVGIVYKNGYLYVANYGRSIITVFKLDKGFNVLKSYNFGTPGIGSRNLNHESNISISENGKYLAVADTNNNRVLIYRIFGTE